MAAVLDFNEKLDREDPCSFVPVLFFRQESVPSVELRLLEI